LQGARSFDPVPVQHDRLELEVGIKGPEDGLGNAKPTHDAGFLDEELGRADGIGRHGRLGRDVASSHVLGERRLDDALERRVPKQQSVT